MRFVCNSVLQKAPRSRRHPSTLKAAGLTRSGARRIVATVLGAVVGVLLKAATSHSFLLRNSTHVLPLVRTRQHLELLLEAIEASNIETLRGVERRTYETRGGVFSLETCY